MKTSFNFPCFLFLILALLVGSCKEMKLDIQESQDRLDVLEGTTIPTINAQIASIDSSILDLQEMDKTLDGYIKSLESTAADLQKQINDNKTEVELELAIINKTLAELKLADLTLEKKVTDLQTYVDTELASAKDWAEATFSTLSQYEQTQTEISAIKASIEQVNADLAALDTRLDGKIEARTAELLSAIAASETNLKTWVGEQLAQSYYDIATLDGILSALSARLDDADTDLQKQIDEQNEALQDAKSELTAAYTSAIKDAISENNGIINASIATAVQKLEDKIQARLTVIDVNISNIQKELANMSKDIASIFEQIAGISSSISDLKDVDKDLDAYIKSLEGELAKMREEFESEKLIDEQEKQLLSQKIVELNALIQALQTKDTVLEGMIDSLQTYVDVKLQETNDWADATFATLEQYSSVQLEIAAIKTLINRTKEEITDEYTTAIETAISNCETDMKAWVNTQLSQGYYNIAAIDGKVSALETLINDGDNNLQEQIDEQKEALKDAKSELTKEYKQYIEQAITADGVIDQAIASKVKSAQDKLQEKIDKISNSIDELEGRISKLESDFVNRIQSLKYVPEFSDRVALMSDYCKSVSVDFLITPVSQAAVLAESWVKESSIIKAFLRYTKVPETRAVNPAIPLVVTSVSSNEEGLLSVTVGENPSYPLNAEFLNGEVPAVLYLHISDGNTEILSDLVDVKTFVEEKLDLSSTESANSYVVSEAGAYKFKAVQGNSETSVGAVASAEVLWETFGTDEVPEVGDLVKYVSCEDGYIAFQTADTFREGNAVIAAKDANGNILWSWHIWLTRKPQGQVYYNSAGTMMDRNLGATSVTPGDVGALGLLYQWGRKDPFLGSSSISSNTLAKSTTTWPSYVTSTSSTGTIDYATKNPTTFIKRNDSNNDWYYTGSEDTDNTRWTTSEKAKSIYDPCPPAWRVPDGRGNGVWAKALGSSLEFSCSISMGKGIEFSGKFGSGYTIWYPASGGRSNNDGSLGNVGYHGRYWSASPGSDCRACLLYFDDLGFVSLSYISLRANGYSVRCLQEYE